MAFWQKVLMKLLQFIPIKLNFFLIAGILIGNQLNCAISIIALFTALSIAFLALVFKKTPYNRNSAVYGLAAAITTIAIGMLSVKLTQASSELHYSKARLDNDDYWHLKIDQRLKGSFGPSYLAKVLSIGKLKQNGKVLLRLSKNVTGNLLAEDDEIIVWAKAKQLNRPLNPHQFDYSKYMRAQEVYHQLVIDNNFYKLPQPSRTINGLAATLRNNISNRLRLAGIKTNELGIIQALLLGDRKEVDPKIYANYKNAGATHMLAVSGLHIGIVLLFLNYLLQPLEYLRKGKQIKLLLVVILLWGFALIASFSASAVRAVSMFTFVAYALYLNRPSNTYNILSLSMFFILLVYNPKFLFQPGFQMSYLAVFFIVWVYPKLQLLWSPNNPILQKLWQLTSVSIAAQVGVLPISLYYFNQFPSLFFVSNLLVIPFLGLILGLGIILIVLALINQLPDFLVHTYTFLIRQMNAVIGWVAEQQAFIIKDISFDEVDLLLSYLLICSIIVLLSKPDFKKVLVSVTAVLAMQTWHLYILQSNADKRQSIIMHQIANTIILHQTGRNLLVYSSNIPKGERLIRNYRVAERILSTTQQGLLLGYKTKTRHLIVIDSLGIFPEQHQPDLVLLTNSPKFNLERYLTQHKPNAIIADGSNYPNYIKRWKNTCLQEKVPFHYTGEKGAYIINKKP